MCVDGKVSSSPSLQSTLRDQRCDTFMTYTSSHQSFSQIKQSRGTCTLFASTTAPDGDPSRDSIILRVYRNTVKRLINALSRLMSLITKPIQSIVMKRSADETTSTDVEDSTVSEGNDMNVAIESKATEVELATSPNISTQSKSESEATEEIKAQLSSHPSSENASESVPFFIEETSVQSSTESVIESVATEETSITPSSEDSSGIIDIEETKASTSSVIESIATEETNVTPTPEDSSEIKDIVETKASISSDHANVEGVPADSSDSSDTGRADGTTSYRAKPKGQRWAVSSADVDMTATWKIIVDDQFKESYDTYLTGLGQPSLVRSIAVSIVELTTEEIIQSNEGREICIKGKNLRGIWERTLLSSGSDYENDHQDDQDHVQVPLITADKETVQAEAWWEEEGTMHVSWLRGGKKYGGGDFESKRYLEDDGNILVCESVFHPRREDKEKPTITWRFQKV